jgi:hypothetical protein
MLTEEEIAELAKYVDLNSLKCRCGCGMDVKYHVKWLLLSQIRHVRDFLGVKDFYPRINSGARCLEHNLRVGGSFNSSHTIGEAVDQGFRTYKEFDGIASWLYNINCKRKIFYFGKSFIHWDSAFGKEVPRPTESVKSFDFLFNVEIK